MEASAAAAAASREVADPNSPAAVDETLLRAVLGKLLSPAMFELTTPEDTVAYFSDIAALQPSEADDSWARRFIGTGESPSRIGVFVELEDLDDSGKFQLARAIVGWNLPVDQARGLYDRLVTELQTVRKRKPVWQRDESDSAHTLLKTGWSWAKGAFETEVVFDTNGKDATERSIPVNEQQPVVLFKVYRPEGP